LVSLLGGRIFKIIGPLTNTHKIAKTNYLRIFPSAKSEEVKKQVINSWENLGRTFFELLILPKIMNSQNNRISVEGMNFLEEIKKNGEQVIFFGIHQSNWEILLPMIDRMDFNVGGIYRHINNPYINKLILNQRKKSIASNDSFYTPKGKKSAKDILDGIKKNSSIVLLIDQKDSAGEDVVFFNSVTKTQTGFLKIAKKHKMQIIPVQNTRNNLNNFTLKFYPPLKPFKNHLTDKQAMEEIHKIIEEWIKENPSHYFLQHNRFS
jgi:KDO2-lipid IV(A) lauroyltransferase